MSSASFGDWIANSGPLVAWISLVVSIATFFITRAEKNKELRQGQALRFPRGLQTLIWILLM